MNSLRRIVARRLVTPLLVSILLLAVPFSALASSDAAVPAGCTVVGGLIGADTTWTAAASPYCVTSSVYVVSGTTLTIKPGVTLMVSPGQGFQIDGTLVARGTAGALINFTSANVTKAAGDWNHLFFTASSVPATVDTNGNYVSGSALQ